MDIRHMRLAAGLLGLLIAWPATAASAAQILHKERLILLAAKPLQAPGRAPAVEKLEFDAFGRRFDISLEPNRALIAASDRLAAARELGIFRGRIDGVEGSWARIVVDDGLPTGLVSDGVDIWGIETLTADDGTTAPHMFRLADVLVETSTLACMAEAPAATAVALVDTLGQEAAPLIERAAGAGAEIDLAVIADLEFATAKGSDSEAALIARINNVDGIFSSQLGVQVNISRIDTFDVGSDPFSDATDAEALLEELSDYRFATQAQRDNGLTHLFTGRNLDGTTVGIAYGSAVCSTRYGVGLTQGTHSTTIDSLIAAHEIGHNFGAPHDGTEDSACESEPQTFLMAPSINGSDQFSACSISQMQSTIASAACITPLSVTDVAIVVSGAPAAVLLGDSIPVEFQANNAGSGTVSDVVVEVAIPAGVALDSVTATGGSCSSGAGLAACSIPSIGPGSGSTIALALTPQDAGAISLTATVSAADDVNPANDSVAVELTATVAVDVAVAVPAAAQVEVGQTLALRPVVENRSTIAATNLMATVTAGAGLEIIEASWRSTPCTIDAGVADCEAAVLGSGEASPIELVMRGSAEAVGSYVIAVAPTEPDRVVSNNSATGRVTVTAAPTASPAPATPSSQPPPAASADGGGGVFGWPSILLLLVGEWLHRRRRRRRATCDRPGTD